MFTTFSDLLAVEDRPHLIGELAERFEVSLRTIRFYEQRGLIAPKRSDPHTRVFQGEDVARLGFIVGCRRLGLSVETIGALLATRDGSDATVFRRDLAAALAAHRDLLTAQRTELDRQITATEAWVGELADEREG